MSRTGNTGGPGAGRRYGRRSVLRYGAWGGAGLVGAFALACGSSKSATNSSGSASNATSAAGTQAAIPAQSQQGQSQLTTLVGRTGKDPSGETPVRGGTFITAQTGNPPTFDAHNTNTINTTVPANASLSKLFRFKTFWDLNKIEKDIEPDLAASYEAVNASTWIYKLRPEAKWHNIAPVNGRAVTSEDIKASFQHAVAPTAANRGGLVMIDPNGIETPDKNTVVFKLNQPTAPFPKLVASSIYGLIIPREGVEGQYEIAKKMIGSGPFMMESYTPDVEVIFKRNPDWFEKGRPYVDGVKLAIVPDAAQRYAQFTAGNLDHPGNPAQKDIPTLTRGNPKAEVLKIFANGNGIMYYNLSEPSSIFQDIRVRQAASLAADRKAYGKIYYDDQYVRTFNVNPDFGKWVITMEELSKETQQWYDLDLQKAKQLLEAAGGSKLSIKLSYPVGAPPDVPLKDQSETMFAMLKALQWNITYVPLDYLKDWQGGGKGWGFGAMPADSMAWWGLASRTDVDELLAGFWYSKSSGNISRLNDPKFDALIEKGRSTVNDDERLKVYKDAQKYLLDNVYSLAGMVNGLTFTMVQGRVRNYQLGDSFGLGGNTWSNLWLAPA